MMDINYSTMTKAELLTVIAGFEKSKKEHDASDILTEKNTARIIKEATDARDDAIRNEYNARQAKEAAEAKADTANSKIEYLTQELNMLADLFNECVTIYKDQLTLFAITANNVKTIQQVLDAKIDAYNRRGNNLQKDGTKK